MNNYLIMKSGSQAMSQKRFCFKCQKFKGKEIEDPKSFQGRIWEKRLHIKQIKQTKNWGGVRLLIQKTLCKKTMGQYFQRTEENYFELDFQTSYTINQI